LCFGRFARAFDAMTQQAHGVTFCVGVKGNPKLKAEATGCTDAVTGLVNECLATAGKNKLKKLSVDIGQEVPVTIVTSMDSISVGSRVVVARVGSFVNEQEVKKTTFGDDISEGLLCDTAMLGWRGGVDGAVALLPASFAPGDSAPSEKPRRGEALTDAAGNIAVCSVNEEIGEVKVLTKEEKKAETALKKAAREAKKKEAKGEVETADDGAARILPKAPNKDLKRIKKLTADKRKKGEEVWTDDELEAAGFAIQGME